MIKYILRKTTYNKLDSQTQDMLLELKEAWYIIIYGITILICFIVPILAICITVLGVVVNNMYLSIIAVLFECVAIFLIGCFNLDTVCRQIYFLIETMKGKALQKKDFRTIKKYNPTLYKRLHDGECVGYCVGTCFDILETLKEGNMEYLACKAFDCEDPKSIKKEFALHVLYVKDGWAFDTYSVRQYKVEEIHKTYNAKVCKTFDYGDIENKTYCQFIAENEAFLRKWCEKNNCSYFNH